MIKNVIHIFLFLMSFISFAQGTQSSAVTYEFSGGRFGDNLLSYLHAKWISYQYQIPLLYKPFKYSEMLKMDEIETRYDLSKHKFHSNILLGRSQQVHPELKSILYLCPYFPESIYERRDLLDVNGNKHAYFEVKWKDSNFRKIVREAISSKQPLNTIVPPKNSINVAVHIREGGGFDPASSAYREPLKRPPLSFYEKGIVEILNTFKGKKVYIYIFTDALKPEEIVNQLKAQCVKQGVKLNGKVTFDYRKTDNHHTQNVLEDFFSLFNFDVLIRPQSNYSIIASLLKDYAIVYAPAGAIGDAKKMEITKIDNKINHELVQNLIDK